jgi:hypothetical protein
MVATLVDALAIRGVYRGDVEVISVCYSGGCLQETYAQL